MPQLEWVAVVCHFISRLIYFSLLSPYVRSYWLFTDLGE